MLERALRTFKNTSDRPTLIIVDSHIAYGAPHNQDTSAAHGEPLGEEEIRLTKSDYRWPEDAKFLVPEEVRKHFQESMGEGGMRKPRGVRCASQWPPTMRAIRSNKTWWTAFIKAFTAKGRLRPLLEAMPVRVSLNDKTALLGAARCATFA